MQWLCSSPSRNSFPKPSSDVLPLFMNVKIRVNTMRAVATRLIYLPNSFDAGITRSLSRRRAPVTMRKQGTAHMRAAHAACAAVVSAADIASAWYTLALFTQCRSTMAKQAMTLIYEN